MRLILFGTGEYYQRYKIWFETEEVCALADNSMGKWGTYIDNKLVISPDKINKYNYDAIFVLTFAIKDITEQLLELGVDRASIYTFYDIHRMLYKPFKRKKIYFFNSQNKEIGNKKIALMNSDLVMGGPALALFNMAKILKKNGYSVTYASMVDGPLRETLIENGFTVIVDNNLLAETMSDNEWINEFSMVICNTINYHVFLSERNTKIPVIWWLHDPPFFYEVSNKKAIEQIDTKNLHVYTVGDIARNAIINYRPDFQTKNLLYGVEENIVEGIKGHHTNKNKVKFITIGFIEPHKGQDILVKAIRELPYNIKSKCEFIFVGKNVSLYAEQLQKAVRDIPEIQFTGRISHAEIHNLLDESDVLICPSRQDCMPTVCAEAMMHSLPCLVSDTTGIVPYITAECGRIFKSEDIEDLKQYIMWFVENSEMLESMGKMGRRVFQQTFSMNAFEGNVMQIIKSVLDDIDIKK